MPKCENCGEIVGAAEISSIGMCETCMGDVSPQIISKLEAVKINEDKAREVAKYGYSEGWDTLFSFKKKMQGSTYFLFGIILPALIIVGPIALVGALQLAGPAFGIIAVACIILGAYITLATLWQRVRDIGGNPYLYFIGTLIPGVGIIVLIYLIFAKSKIANQ